MQKCEKLRIEAAKWWFFRVLNATQFFTRANFTDYLHYQLTQYPSFLYHFLVPDRSKIRLVTNFPNWKLFCTRKTPQYFKTWKNSLCTRPSWPGNPVPFPSVNVSFAAIVYILLLSRWCQCVWSTLRLPYAAILDDDHDRTKKKRKSRTGSGLAHSYRRNGTDDFENFFNMEKVFFHVRKAL